MGEKSNFIDFENIEEIANETVATGVTDFSKEEEMLKAVISKNSAKTEAELLYKSAKDENEKLMLRQTVVQASYPDEVKVTILDALDEYIRAELTQEIALANSIEEIQKDNSTLIPGVIGMVIIGFVVSIFFPIAWVIGILLAVVGYFSAKKENKEKMQSAMIALEKVEKYRKAGYRV